MQWLWGCSNFGMLSQKYHYHFLILAVKLLTYIVYYFPVCQLLISHEFIDFPQSQDHGKVMWPHKSAILQPVFRPLISHHCSVRVHSLWRSDCPTWGHIIQPELMSFGQFYPSSIISLELCFGMFDHTWHSGCSSVWSLRITTVLVWLYVHILSTCTSGVSLRVRVALS